MSLAEGLSRVMASRGLTTRDILARLGEQRDRATVYRLLAGQTENPRLDTLLSLCAAMETSPNELLDQAEVFPKRPRSADPHDLRLRRAFSRLQTLPPESKVLAVTQVLLLVETWARAAEGRAVEEVLDRIDEYDAGCAQNGG
jgi:transcriptional regulator with XRE-family HTH domain